MPHSINTNGEEGFSFVYNYPGFFSYFGQANLYYTNSFGDSFFGGIGEIYLIGGINKRIVTFQKSSINLNLNIGTMFEKTYLGSFGLSYLIDLTPNLKFELVADLFFNHGTMQYFFTDKAYSKGFVVGLNFGRKITENLLIHFGTGIALIQYRYVYHSVGIPYNYYVSRNMEEFYVNEMKAFDSASWDSRIIIPIGITLTYHF